MLLAACAVERAWYASRPRSSETSKWLASWLSAAVARASEVADADARLASLLSERPDR